MFFNYIIYQIFINNNKKINNLHTALTAGGMSDADIATPIKEPVLSPSTAMATATPDSSAITLPTNSELTSPL